MSKPTRLRVKALRKTHFSASQQKQKTMMGHLRMLST